MTETMEKQLSLIIEALIFTSEKPLTAREIHTCLPDETPADIRQALKELKREYDEMGRSFVIKEVAQGFQFRTRAEYAPYIVHMLKTSPTRLSQAALETLAIIAYKQPILRHEVERLRGVDVGGIIRTLMEKNLVNIMGRKDLPGRPLIYGTSKKFLEIFELKDIDSLPKLKEIKDLGTNEQGTKMPLKEVLPNETQGKQEESEDRNKTEIQNEQDESKAGNEADEPDETETRDKTEGRD